MLSALVAKDLRKPRLMAWLTSVLASVTVMLALVGVYAAAWQIVVERRPEIGIRHALGAGRGMVPFMIVRQTLPWMVTGILVGVFCSWSLSRYLVSLLPEVGETRLLTVLMATGVVFTAACVGTYLPTRKASRVDPADTFKV